jgi:hypothetical protein
MSTTSVARGNINRPSLITTCYFYKTVFSGILPLKSKIRINVIPSPGFKLVVLIGFRDDSWVFLNVFLNGHNIKRVHLCPKLKINNYITSVFHWNVTIWLVMKWSHDYKRDVSHPNATQIRTCTCLHDDVILLKFHWGMKALIELHFQHEENFCRFFICYLDISSRYVFSCVICFRFIHFILISTAHALFLTCLPVSIYGT